MSVGKSVWWKGTVWGGVLGMAFGVAAVPALGDDDNDNQPVLNVGGVERDGTGVIRGIVKTEGQQRPRPPYGDFRADQFCVAYWRGKDRPLQENYVWGDNNTLQNVVVFVSGGLEGKDIPQLQQNAVLDQIGCVYVPHVLAVQAGQTLEIHNSDNTMHNVNFRSSGGNPNFNEATVQGVVLEKQFSRHELGGVFACNVHPWMGARLAVFEHPFFAVTQQDGTFEIRGLEPGEYEITTWHQIRAFRPDQATYNVTVEAGGTAEVTVTYQLPAPRQ